MFSEDDLLPLSSLQHLSFCPRQWGLIHLEGIWSENVSTLEGRFLHEKSDGYATEAWADVRIARGLRLRSLRLGLSGKADVVEFHRMPKAEGSRKGIRLAGARGLWTPYPVEYKRGRPKMGHWDEVQLCAQALCLEEMLDVVVPEGALFYGKTRRRHEVRFVAPIREEPEALAGELHELSGKGVTPAVEYSSRCKGCSIMDACLPLVAGKKRSVIKYLNRMLDMLSEPEGDL